MTLEITIVNRQRSQKVDLDWFHNMTSLVSQAIFANLKKSLPKHLRRKNLLEMERRGQLSLALVSNQKIKRLNAEWRGKNLPTDVLSFPLTLSPPPANCPWEIGEIVISSERALEQALYLGHSIEREFAFLFAHGFLHVLGFDHQTKSEEKDMFGRQSSVLKSAGFNRRS
jgi:probable rRNA maturation factor